MQRKNAILSVYSENDFLNYYYHFACRHWSGDTRERGVPPLSWRHEGYRRVFAQSLPWRHEGNGRVFAQSLPWRHEGYRRVFAQSLPWRHEGNGRVFAQSLPWRHEGYRRIFAQSLRGGTRTPCSNIASNPCRS